MKRAGRCANPQATFKFLRDGTIAMIGVQEDKEEKGEKSPAIVRSVRRKAQQTGLRVGKVEIAPKPDFWAERQRRIQELLNR